MSLCEKKTNEFSKYFFCLDIPPIIFAAKKSRRLTTTPLKRHRPVSLLKASFSLEAAVVMPIVICVLVFAMMFFRILAVQWGIEKAFQETARRSAAYGDTFGNAENEGFGIFSTGVMVASAMAEINANKVLVKFIEGGLLGINLTSSGVDEKDINLTATYKISMPFKLLGDKSIRLIQNTRVRRWTGYNPTLEKEEEDYVYVTKHGVAYHLRIDCTYLNPSISAVSPSDVGEKRNESGGKYYPCDRCGLSSSGIYYITNYGTVYHTKLSCSSLKRTISRVTLEEAQSSGKHSCPKCGG